MPNPTYTCIRLIPTYSRDMFYATNTPVGYVDTFVSPYSKGYGSFNCNIRFKYTYTDVSWYMLSPLSFM